MTLTTNAPPPGAVLQVAAGGGSSGTAGALRTQGPRAAPGAAVTER